MFTDVPLEKITIGPRFRQDLGDIAELAKSIESVGLLHPIIVTKAYDLIVGRRRLEAYTHLKRATIPAFVLDLDRLLNAEFDENEQRKALNPSERVAIIEALYEYEQTLAKQRQRDHGKTAPGRKKNTCGNLPQVIGAHPRVRELAAKAVGWSPHTYEKAKKVVEAARQYDELQDFVEEMDRTGNVTRAYNHLPAYAHGTEEDDEAPRPRKRRRLPYLTVFKRVDHLMQETVVPRLQDFTDMERANLRELLQYYIALIAKEEEAAHAGSDC